MAQPALSREADNNSAGTQGFLGGVIGGPIIDDNDFGLSDAGDIARNAADDLIDRLILV